MAITSYKPPPDLKGGAKGGDNFSAQSAPSHCTTSLGPACSAQLPSFCRAPPKAACYTASSCAHTTPVPLAWPVAA